MQLQDRSGGSPEYLAEQTQRFMEAARKRPEIGRIGTLYRATRAAGLRRHRSQQGAQVRRAAERRQHHARRAARQLLHQRLQQVRPRLQGVRAGRAGVPAGPEAARAVLRPEPDGRHGPARHAGHDAGPASGPEFTNRFNLFRSAELTGVPARRLLVDAGARRARGDRARGAAAGHELRLGRHVVPGAAGAGRGRGVRARRSSSCS